jgi:hypothetical protein
MFLDVFVRSRKPHFCVIPAKAGIQEKKDFWTPVVDPAFIGASAGVTVLMPFYGIIDHLQTPLSAGSSSDKQRYSLEFWEISSHALQK